ncbi:arylesterase [Qipengyuania soli]|uniref:Arylesterase n=1 Tax=Qipengyuania soli TaxID=2782568 RepID=A0A7S8F2F4_9SPHN|nr:arylesterase [Qipengyuania soli]QPC97994.1 arylesterase [Qipengyuania soli]
MRLSHWSIALLAPVLAACSQADTVAEPAETTAPSATSPERKEVAGPERRILAFGDSLFAGYGVGLTHSYPTKLEYALRDKGINAIVTNAAVSGETSAAGAKRFAFALDAQKVKPDLIMLELGGNDMLRGLQPTETRANFAAMLGEAKKRGIPVLLMGMRAPPNYGPEYQAEFDSLYGELAKEYGAAIVPFWLEAIYEKPQLFQADRIHPTIEGIDLLVEDTLDEVQAALPPVG